MKRIFKPILIVTLIALLALSVFGCNYKSDSGSGGSGGGGGSGGKTVTYANYTDYANLPSIDTSSIEYQTHDTPYETLQIAANAIKGSSIAITVNNGKELCSGSGVIVDMDDGTLDDNQFYVITCNHMVENVGTNITAYLPDEKFEYGNEAFTLTGRLNVVTDTVRGVKQNGVFLVGGDKESDIAVLKINVPDEIKDKVVKAPIMSENTFPEYAEKVFAIGNPSGTLPGTYSEGNIAYLNRKESVSSVGEMFLTQISLFTNHGSSGGGLYNINGELIGITNAGQDEYQGLNFAIPHAIPEDVRGEGTIDNGFINIAKQLIASKNKMKNNFGYVYGKRAKFGFSTMENGNNLLVASVEETGMANGKLSVGDLIYGIKNKDGDCEVKTNEALTSKIKSTKVGEEFTLYINRSGGKKEVVFKVYQYYLFNTGDYTVN